MNYPTYDEAAAAIAGGREPAEDDSPASGYATLEELMAPPAGGTDAEDFTLPASGKVVRIRPMTRAEVLAINNKDLDLAGREQRYISKAMVEPRITVEMAKRWQEKGHAGDIGELVDRIGTISGLTKRGEKAAAKDFPLDGE
jgi:hypothetical protein